MTEDKFTHNMAAISTALLIAAVPMAKAQPQRFDMRSPTAISAQFVMGKPNMNKIARRAAFEMWLVDNGFVQPKPMSEKKKNNILAGWVVAVMLAGQAFVAANAAAITNNAKTAYAIVQSVMPKAAPAPQRPSAPRYPDPMDVARNAEGYAKWGIGEVLRRALPFFAPKAF